MTDLERLLKIHNICSNEAQIESSNLIQKIERNQIIADALREEIELLDIALESVSGQSFKLLNFMKSNMMRGINA